MPKETYSKEFILSFQFQEGRDDREVKVTGGRWLDQPLRAQLSELQAGAKEHTLNYPST